MSGWLRLSRQDRVSGRIIAASAGDGPTHFILLRDKGTFQRIKAVKLEGAESTWPVDCHESTRRFLLMGSKDNETTTWGVIRIDSNGQLVVTQSPLNTQESFVCRDCRGTGKFTENGAKLLITQLPIDKHSAGPISQVFEATRSDSLLKPWPRTIYEASSALREDGRWLVSAMQLPEQTFVTTTRLASDTLSDATTASLDGNLEFEMFGEDNYAVFRAGHTLRSYELPIDKTEDVVDEHDCADCRYRQWVPHALSWYEFRPGSLYVVTLTPNGNFRVHERKLEGLDEHLQFISHIEVSADGRFCAVLTPDSKLSIILELDEDVRSRYVPEEARSFVGFSPDEKWALLGSGAVDYEESSVPGAIEFVPLN